ncbi:putative aminotransferase [Shewanella benthica KT99]|uniref:Putative aminotransferase n=1 Tax=Shewanella benthica KT99 TaxID=314608 RepID=A9D872_9GAMM|nr:putative aminotransferase [Shewanella benthica KT99]
MSLWLAIFTQPLVRRVSLPDTWGLANQYNAINLSQGFPEFDAPKRLKQGLAKYCNQGFNQYAPSSGLAPLQTQIASLIGRQYGIDVNPNDTITVTSGATEALFVTIQTITHPGDEIIIFDPAYDSYKPAIELAGGWRSYNPTERVLPNCPR